MSYLTVFEDFYFTSALFALFVLGGFYFVKSSLAIKGEPQLRPAQSETASFWVKCGSSARVHLCLC